MLKDKKVIVVGPASYLEGSKKGNFIESFDVVVRLNNGYDIHESYIEDVGKRTDVLYHCLWGPHFPNSIPHLNQKVKYLKCSYPNILPFSLDIGKFNKVNRDRIKFEPYQLSKYEELFNILESRPNTGTSAIYDLMSYEIKSLHISGITMFDGGYLKKYRNSHVHSSREEVEMENKKFKIHNIQSQIEFLKVFLKNEKITLDKNVGESIYG